MYDLTWRSLMPANDARVDFDLAVRVAELRADMRYAQSDITEIRAELRATKQRLDSLSQKWMNDSKRAGASNRSSLHLTPTRAH